MNAMDAMTKFFKHPALPKVLTSPEVLLGIGGVFCIIYFAGSQTFFKQEEERTGTIAKEIASTQEEVKKREDYQTLLARIQAEARTPNLQFYPLTAGAQTSMVALDVMKLFRDRATSNPLGLPQPHHEVEVVELKLANEGEAASPSVVNLLDAASGPFVITEAAQLASTKLELKSFTYNLSLRGTYVGLMGYLYTLLQQEPVASVLSLKLHQDAAAPSVLLFRPGTVMAPNRGEESGNGKHRNVLGVGTTSANAQVEGELKAKELSKQTINGAAATPPLLLDLKVRVYLDDNPPTGTVEDPTGAAAAGAPASGSTPAVAALQSGDLSVGLKTAAPNASPAP
jgi:hypothetical protein